MTFEKLLSDIKNMDGAGKRLQNFYGISPTTVRKVEFDNSLTG